jgi:UDP-N-acetylglucosamine 3-dehydrogenase
MTRRVGFIGTGNPDGDGFAMAYHHASGYERLDCALVACADIVAENGERFAREHGIDEDRVYEDYEEMLNEASLDIVSICVPPALHPPAVSACVRSGIEAVHCEKPMATTWGDSRRMALDAWRHDVQLTFNHQRRFSPEWNAAKELLDAGEIGELERIEMAAPDLFDWGTHCFDLCGMFVDEAHPEWVLSGLDFRTEKTVFGANIEDQGFACWQYENGVFGLASTGSAGNDDGRVDCGFIDALHRLLGSDGVIEIHHRWGEDGKLRIRRSGDTEWEMITVEETDDLNDLVPRAIEEVVTALDEERESPLSARRALTATELIFGAYESTRCRGRVEFPLDIDDNPLEDMIKEKAMIEEDDKDRE